MSSPVFLRVYYKGELSNIKQFSEAQIVIGSGDDAVLKLENENISLVHAVIEKRDSGYYITDLGSDSGTFKNGNKILDEKMESGESFTISDYKIEFFIGVPKPASVPVPNIESETTTEITQPSLEINEATIVEPIKKVEEPPAKKIDKKQPAKKEEPKANPVKMSLPKEAYEEQKVFTGPSNRKKVTFAPPSENKDLLKIIKPSRGAALEVTVSWKERIIGTYLYKNQTTVKIGSKAKNDIIIPLLGLGQTSYKLLSYEGGVAQIFVSPEMTGQLVADGKSTGFQDLVKLNRLVKKGNGFVLSLSQGELLKLNLFGETISIFIKYKEEVVAPIGGPFMDFSFSELTGMLISVALVALMGLYMLIYSAPEVEPEEDPLRKVTVTFNAPKLPPQPKKVVELTKKVNKVKTKKLIVKKKQSAGKSKAVRKVKKKRSKRKMISAFRGGSRKTGKKKASSAKSKPKKNVKELGLLSAFGGGGINNKLSKSFTGSGTLSGAADLATGSTGDNQNRVGDNMGTRLQATGGGGRGKSTVGAIGVDTGGLGSGTSGVGTGGLSKRGRVKLDIDGEEADFVGTIDRDAVRRVIKNNIRSFKHCYSTELRRKSNLFGRVSLQWYIVERGKAKNVKIYSTTIKSKKMMNCLKRKMAGLQFPEPPPNTKVKVIYPFVFTSR